MAQPPDDVALEDDSLIGEVISGRYRLLEVLGEGGAGRVYRAIQAPLGREVAVKMVRADITAETRREFAGRFAREASLAGRLSHPNVVHVHDYGVSDDGEQYVVMEVLRGESLKDAMAEGAFDPIRAAWIAEGVARGLAHAHAHGLVHRDIKPSNVFLVPEPGGRERAVILDFGLVKDLGPADDITRSGTYMGTPAYTAPEQAKDEPLDGRADLYSLGVLAYRMLTGALPYQAGSSMGTVVQHVTQAYPPMATRAPDVRVDPKLEAIVRRAMEKEPAKRWQTAEEMAEAFEAWRAGRAIPTGRSADREWVLPVLGGLGAASLVVGAGALLVLVALGALLLGPGAPAPVTGSAPAAPAREAPAAAAPPAPERAAAVPVEAAPVEAVPVEAVPVEAAPAEAAPAAVTPPPKPRKPLPAAPRDPPPPRPVPRADAPVVAAGAGAVVVDDVSFTPEHADRALAWINTATEQQLRDAKVYDRGVGVILAGRPFVSITAFGETPWIGEATVKAAAAATKEP